MSANFPCVLCNNKPFNSFESWKKHLEERHGNPYLPKTLEEEKARYEASYRVASEALSRIEARRNEELSPARGGFSEIPSDGMSDRSLSPLPRILSVNPILSSHQLPPRQQPASRSQSVLQGLITKLKKN